jgi:hypothetical protein
LVVGGVLAVVARTTLRRRVVVCGAIAAASALAALSARQLWAMNESISGGAFLSLGNVLPNLRRIAAGDSLAVDGAIALLALGVLVAVRRSGDRGVAWLLFSTGVAAGLAVLAYDRFHERMLLGATVALVPLLGFPFASRPPVAAPERRRGGRRPLAALALVVLIVLLWSGRLRSAAVPPETQVLETRIAARVAQLPLAADALFIAEQPTVLAASGMWPVMATARALENDDLTRALGVGRPIYFLRDMYCEPGFGGMTSPSRCAQMIERFVLSAVAEETLHNRAYILYRVSTKE